MTQKLEVYATLTTAEAKSLNKGIAVDLRNAVESNNQTIEHANAANEKLVRMYRGDGWRVLNFPSFSSFMETEHGIKKSQGYRLLDKALICLQLGVELPEKQARVLAAVPEEQRSMILLSAQESLKEGEELTSEKIAAAATEAGFEVVKRQASSGGGSSKTTKSSGGTSEPGHPDYKKDEQLSDAINRIVEICGHKHLRAAIVEGTVELSKKQILQWAGQSDESIAEMEPLITGGPRWTPAEALAFVSSVPDESTKVTALKNYAISAGGLYEADIDGFRVVIATPEIAKKLERAVKAINA